MTTKKEWALYYATMLGWRVFPVQAGTKAGQLLKSWKQEATNDPATIARWWDAWPDANICLAIGNDMVVIDQDSPAHKQGGNGPDGIIALGNWQAENGAFPATLTARTPSGGRHTYFQTVKPYGNRTSIILGVDVRGVGGYVLLPPSSVDGKPYEWAQGCQGIATANAAVYAFLDGAGATAQPISEVDRAVTALELKPLLEALNTIPCADVSYLDWIHIGMALFNSGAPLGTWERWSATDAARYKPGECAEKWRSFGVSKTNWNAGTIYRMAKSYGYTEGQDGAAPPLEQFHKISAKGAPIEILDSAIEDYVLEKMDIFVLHNKAYVYRDGCYRMDEDGKEIKSFIRGLIYPDLVTSHRIDRVFSLLISDNRISIDDDGVNLYPKRWINFKNGMLDCMTGELREHSPKYRAINQIPYDYDPRAAFDGSVADKFFQGIMPDKADRDMFYAFVGYCMTMDTGYQKFLVLLGVPGAGKSTANNLVTLCIGKENTCSMPLQDLNKRFQATVLLHKLLNVSSDIPNTPMEQTSAIRLITGEDQVKGEYKGGKIFNFDNYARLLFSANDMPAVLNEDPDAFYRRLMVINITKRGPEIEGLDEGLEKSRPGFIAKCVQTLQMRYILGQPLDSPNSAAAVAQLKRESDSVMEFFAECLDQDVNGKIAQKELYTRYHGYCLLNHWTPKPKHSFFTSIRAMGFRSGPTNGTEHFFGLRFRDSGNSGL